jgi:hypothetical protein
MKKIVRENLNEIKRGESNTLSIIGAGASYKTREWCQEMAETHNISKDYTVLSNGEVNASWVDLDPEVEWWEIPIKFNVVDSFSSRGLTLSLGELSDALPRLVNKELDIASNPPVYTVRDILNTCDLGPDARVILNSETRIDVHGRYKLRRTPKREDRLDNVMPRSNPDTGKIDHSYGFKTYSALKYIQKAGEKGRSYLDIVTHIYQLSYPGKDLPYTGYWSAGFREGGQKWHGGAEHPGPMHIYTDKVPSEKGKRMRYVINDAGRQYLANNKGIFER